MRRPLPSQADTSASPVANPAPTPTPTPGGTPAPTPTPGGTPVVDPDDGLTLEPDDSPIVSPNPSVFGYYEWTVGDWKGGQCGVDSTSKRSVQCTFVFFDPSKNYEQGAAHVADTYCADQGAKPNNTYVGKGAGCDYHLVKTAPGPWDGTCSRDAKRKLNYECRDVNDAKVPLTYCTEGLGADGKKMEIKEFEYGNYSSCGYEWTSMVPNTYTGFDGYQGEKLYGAGAGYHHYCGQPGDDKGTSGVQGPVLYVLEKVYCARSDGMEVEDSKCDASTRPEDGIHARGTCHRAFHVDGTFNTTGEVCLSDGGVVLRKPMSQLGDGIDAACNSMIKGGATCCMLRMDQDVRGSAGYEVLATNGSKTKYGDGSYYSLYEDQGKSWRAGGSSNLEYNSDSCELKGFDGSVIETLQPYMCQ